MKVEISLNEICDGIQIMRVALIEPVRKGAAAHSTLAVGPLAFPDARRAGPDQNRDPMRSVLAPRARDSFLEAVLAQADLGKAVIAAVELCQTPDDRLVFEAFHAPDPGVEPGGKLQIVVPQAATAGTQRRKCRFATQSKRVRGGDTSNDQRPQSGSPAADPASIPDRVCR